jgi:hypothetical protein
MQFSSFMITDAIWSSKRWNMCEPSGRIYVLHRHLKECWRCTILQNRHHLAEATTPRSTAACGLAAYPDQDPGGIIETFPSFSPEDYTFSGGRMNCWGSGTCHVHRLNVLPTILPRPHVLKGCACCVCEFCASSTYTDIQVKQAVL